MSVEMVELVVKAPEPVRPAGILQQNRVFLDFFWDLAKPDQEVRLKAVEDLIQYLRSNNKADELEYTFKRLVDGLAHTRETARPGFSLALGQVSAHDRQTYFTSQCVYVHPAGQIPEEVFEEVLLSALQTDLASAFSTPEQMQLLLVALQRFPQTLKPKKLKKLLGSTTIINADNIPKLTEVLKKAAHSVKKECVLPAVVLDLLKLSLKEDSFQLFWNKAIVEGMLKQQSGPTHYLSFRLLGSALPLLSVEQLKEVLSGDVMTHYGEHVVSAQKPDRFKLAPEMDTYVSDFLQNCQDSEKQLVVMVAFSSLTNMGYPVVPSVWRVVQHLQPAALQDYVDWLKSMFVQPQLDKLLDFSTRKQKDNQEGKEEKENSIFRLRKWIVSRLTSIIDNHHVKKQEDLVMDVARFVFFHALFSAKKASADVAETKVKLSVPIDEKTRGVLVTDSAEGAAVNQKRAMGVTADGTMWIYHLVQYAQVLLTQPKSIQSSQPFSPEQRQAWDSMLESVASLKKKSKKDQTAESSAFQQLFLLVGMHLFKVRHPTREHEPEWVEVMVDILLSLLSQPSRHIRQVCKTVFSSICPHVTAAALTAILDVSNTHKVLLCERATEEDGSSDEDLDDDAMMEMDKKMSVLFSEQKKKTQAKKDEKTKLLKEKTLVRDFKIKVLDLIEVFVARQAGSPLVLSLVEPLLALIDRGMSSGSNQQEQDFLRRAADIFRNQLCRSKVYCKTVGDRQGELHDLLDKMMSKTQKLSDSSVGLYYFSASLYVVKVLRGAPPAADAKEEQTDEKAAENEVCLPQTDRCVTFVSIHPPNQNKQEQQMNRLVAVWDVFPTLKVNMVET
uniref:Myb-binding protein 1A-like protein n=1 Tax=Scophthalmus maximus TaxID=52904 RepID=A0A8D3CWQ4_SCOMX